MTSVPFHAARKSVRARSNHRRDARVLAANPVMPNPSFLDKPNTAFPGSFPINDATHFASSIARSTFSPCVCWYALNTSGLSAEPREHLSQFLLVWPVSHNDHLPRIDITMHQECIEIPYSHHDRPTEASVVALVAGVGVIAAPAVIPHCGTSGPCCLPLAHTIQRGWARARSALRGRVALAPFPLALAQAEGDRAG